MGVEVGSCVSKLMGCNTCEGLALRLSTTSIMHHRLKRVIRPDLSIGHLRRVLGHLGAATVTLYLDSVHRPRIGIVIVTNTTRLLVPYWIMPTSSASCLGGKHGRSVRYGESFAGFSHPVT